MTSFVMDNSIAMRWLLASEKKSNQAHAKAVLASLVDVDAAVPNLWHLEAANVFVTAEKRGELETGDIERFIAQLESLPIQVDPMTAHRAFSRTLSLSKAYKLSSYDAA